MWRACSGYRSVVEPIPPSIVAADDLDPVADDALLPERLAAVAERARELVPDLVGVSLASVRKGVTITVVASSDEIAILDAVQYLAGGPCQEAIDVRATLDLDEGDLFDEQRWQLFAQATASRAVRSTLSLPIVGDDGRVVGSVNLYGGSARAFEDLHDALAGLFGAWAPGAVTNADLSFATRHEAQRAPRVLSERARIETSIGLVAADSGEDVHVVERRLEDAASRAQVSVLELAETVIEASAGRGLK